MLTSQEVKLCATRTCFTCLNGMKVDNFIMCFTGPVPVQLKTVFVQGDLSPEEFDTAQASEFVLAAMTAAVCPKFKQ